MNRAAELCKKNLVNMEKKNSCAALALHQAL